MKPKTLSIRPFIGSKNYEESRSFYRDLGFEEVVLFPNMCLFKTAEIGFYLQDAYVEDWINNTMVFLEVDDAEAYWNKILALNLTTKYDTVKLVPIRKQDWGSECFIRDPSGILWHIGTFAKK